MALEFNVLIDAIRLPPALTTRCADVGSVSSTSAKYRYQVTWSAGRQEGAEGATVALTPSEEEVLFHHDVAFRAPNPPDRLLQLTVLQFRNDPRNASGSLGRTTEDKEKSVVGVLVIDLNAHVPKPGSMQSKQRATLAVSLCPFDPPLMVRLAVESTRSHLPYDFNEERRLAADERRRSASRARSVSQQSSTPTGASTPVVPPLQLTAPPAPVAVELLDDVAMEMARMKAALQSITASNRQLRDENSLLRTAVQKAREEPSYTFVGNQRVSRPAGSTPAPETPLESPPPRPPSEGVASSHHIADTHSILEAEVAVLQRGLQAAKAKLKEKDETEAELRAEIKSLTMTNQFQSEDIVRLEQELERYESQQQEAISVDELKRSLLEVQSKNRVLSAELQTEERLRAKLSDDFKSLKKEYDACVRRREESLAEEIERRNAHTSLVQQLESRLDKAAQEVEKLHRATTEANGRCEAVAKIVAAQSKIIENKNSKIRALKALLDGSELLKKHLDKRDAQGDSVGKQHAKAALTPRSSTNPSLTPRGGRTTS